MWSKPEGGHEDGKQYTRGWGRHALSPWRPAPRRLPLPSRSAAARSWAGSSTTTPSRPELATHTEDASLYRRGGAGELCPHLRSRPQ